MQRFVLLASVFFPCSATFVCLSGHEFVCHGFKRMFYHGHYRVAIYALEICFWNSSGETHLEFERNSWVYLGKSAKILNPWQLGLVSPDSDRNSMKFLSEDGFCEIQDDEVSRFHWKCGWWSLTTFVRLMQKKSKTDDHGWSLPVPQEPMTSWHLKSCSNWATFQMPRNNAP